MIYINEYSGAVSVSRHNSKDVSAYFRMVLTSNMCNDIILVNDGNDISTNPLYYKFPLNDLSNLYVGEYTYKLYGSDNPETVLETGLLVFGNYERKVVVNNSFEKEKIQYNG